MQETRGSFSEDKLCQEREEFLGSGDQVIGHCTAGLSRVTASVEVNLIQEVHQGLPEGG
jgi:hypothetical protein